MGWTPGIVTALCTLALGLALTALAVRFQNEDLARHWFGISGALLLVFFVALLVYGILQTVGMEMTRRIFATGAAFFAMCAIGWPYILRYAGLPPTSVTATGTATPPRIPKVLDVFMFENHTKTGVMWLAYTDFEIERNAVNHTVRVPYIIYSDVTSNSKYISFYIPATQFAFDIAKNLATSFKRYFTDIESSHSVSLGAQGSGSNPVSTKALIFTGRVYLYHENLFTNEQSVALTKAFGKHKAQVELRGPEAATAAWMSIRAGDIKPLPEYELKDGLPGIVRK